MNMSDEAAAPKAITQTSHLPARTFSEQALNSRASGMSKLENIQNEAFGRMNMSSDELAADSETLHAQGRHLARTAQGDIRNRFYKKGGRAELNDSDGFSATAQAESYNKRKDDLIMGLAVNKAAETLQRSACLDPLSKIANVGNTYQNAARMSGMEDITKELSGGGINLRRGKGKEFVKTGDMKEALASEATAVVKAFKELAAESAKGTEELGVFRSKLEESTENFNKLKDAAGGGGASASSRLSALSGGFQAASMA